MSIDIENCSFVYPSTNIGIHNISISADDGELVAVIGSSGSGKTTLLKLVAGFERANSGTIKINGTDVSRFPPRKRNVGMVFQSYALFPLMSCIENVAYPIKIRKVPAKERYERAMNMLERVGLASYANVLPGTLSGGQQQRVALARALSFNPDILLLDEPLSALDAGLRIELRREIRRLQKEQGITALHVTHDQEEALSIADKVALMHQGKIVQIASPHELYDAPVSKLVASFVGHANLWDGMVVDSETVKVDFGDMRCNTKQYKQGDKVVVLVRPERVIPNINNKLNSFEGRITSDSFLGSVRRYVFTTKGGSIQGETSLRGEFGKVGIPPEAITLLPFEEE